MSPPEIPASAPFNAVQRLWLNGYLAALYSDTSSSPSVEATSKERVLVLYASQSGNCETLAGGFGEQLMTAGFEAPVLAMDEFAAEELSHEKALIIVSSTWGEGDPPDNAVDFWEALSNDGFRKLGGLKYAVLGLGDTNYLEFCGMGKKFDERLEALGATRFAPRGDCDTDFEETSSAWFESTLKALGATAEAKSDAPESETVSYSKKNPFPAKLLTNRLLNAEDSERDTRHFEFSLEGSGMSYEVGDVLGVYGKNDPMLVDEVIEAISLDPAEQIDGTPLREALLERYDIRAVSPAMLKEWPVPVEGDFHEVIDLANATKPRFQNANAFVSLLRKLGPRLYSISSSPKAHPDEVHLTVAKVQYECDGRPRKGVCSTYLADRVNGDRTVPVFLQTAKHFKLPTDLSVPVIMVGPGTGIAPFRAFLEERAATNSPGKNWLFFGNPHEATDWFYQEEFDKMSDTGVLSKLSTAWSRDQDTKVYVQDRMREAGAELWLWLEEGAHLYVCGDAKRMAKDVDQALHDAVETHGNLSKEAATDYVSAMKKAKRYQRDVY